MAADAARLVGIEVVVRQELLHHSGARHRHIEEQQDFVLGVGGAVEIEQEHSQQIVLLPLLADAGIGPDRGPRFHHLVDDAQAVVSDGASTLGDLQAQIGAAVAHLGLGLAPGFKDEHAAVNLGRRAVLLHRKALEARKQPYLFQPPLDPVEGKIGHLCHRGNQGLALRQLLEKSAHAFVLLVGPDNPHQAHTAALERQNPTEFHVFAVLVAQLEHALANPVVTGNGDVQLADGKLGGEFLRPAVPTV